MLLEVLKELCKVLEIKPDSVEQRSCISLMESAACIHTASLDKVCSLPPEDRACSALMWWPSHPARICTVGSALWSTQSASV